MVIGSRFLEKESGYRSTFVRRLGIRLFQSVNSLLIGQRVTDNTSGFRAYDRQAIDFLARYYPIDYPEPEAVILLGKNGFRIAEVDLKLRGPGELLGQEQSGLPSFRFANLTEDFSLVERARSLARHILQRQG